MYNYMVAYRIVEPVSKILNEELSTKEPITPVDLNTFERKTTYMKAIENNNRFLQIHILACSRIK